MSLGLLTGRISEFRQCFDRDEGLGRKAEGGRDASLAHLSHISGVRVQRRQAGYQEILVFYISTPMGASANLVVMRTHASPEPSRRSHRAPVVDRPPGRRLGP